MRQVGRPAYPGSVSVATSSGVSRTGVLISLAAVAVTAALLLWVPPLHDAAAAALRGDTNGLRTQLRDQAGWGILVLLAVVLAHVVVPYPAEIPTAAAGFVYGFWIALPMIMVMWLLSALVTYVFGRHAARPLLYRLAGQRRFDRAESAIQRGGAPVLIAARLVPVVPFSLTGFVAGAAHVPVVRFAWTTAVGFLPLTLVVTLLGSRLDSLSLSDPLIYLALVPLLVLLLAAKPLARHFRVEPEAEESLEPR